jgi:hypothetical protein
MTLEREVRSARVQVERLEKRASDADWNWEVAKKELEEHCEAFAQQWRDASLLNLRKGAGQINRQADKLIAAQKLPAAREELSRAQAAMRERDQLMGEKT